MEFSEIPEVKPPPAPQPRSRTPIAVILILIIALATLSVFNYNLNTQVAQLEADLADLKIQTATQLTSLRTQLTNLRPPTSNATNSILGIEELYASTVPSVVAIKVQFKTPGFFGPRRGVGEGSGFIIDPKGYIITNYHVVKDSTDIEIFLHDGSSLRGKLVGSDAYSDIAIIQAVDPPQLLQALHLGDSSKLRIGEPVVAIGNPLGLAGSVTSGIVSQVGRTLPANQFSIPNVIQIDVAVNPGNSGGPLLNRRGEVVGITTAIASSTGTFSGIGFAIPSNIVKREYDSLIVKGTYEHPWLGISSVMITNEIKELMKVNVSKGILIAEVFRGSPAERAGLRAGNQQAETSEGRIRIGGDIIVAVDGIPISAIDTLLAYMEENKKPGDKLSLTIIRGGAPMKVEVTLGVRPPPPVS